MAEQGTGETEAGHFVERLNKSMAGQQWDPPALVRSYVEVHTDSIDSMEKPGTVPGGYFHQRTGAVVARRIGMKQVGNSGHSRIAFPQPQSLPQGRLSALSFCPHSRHRRNTSGPPLRSMMLWLMRLLEQLVAAHLRRSTAGRLKAVAET